LLKTNVRWPDHFEKLREPIPELGWKYPAVGKIWATKLFWDVQ